MDFMRWLGGLMLGRPEIRDEATATSWPTATPFRSAQRKLGKSVVQCGPSTVEIERTGDCCVSVKVIDGPAGNIRFYPCYRCGHEVAQWEMPCPHCGATGVN